MTTAGLRLLAGICVCLSVGVIANVLLLQGEGAGHIRGGHKVSAVADRVSAPAPRGVGQQRSSLSGADRLRAPVQPPRQLIRVIQRELAQRKYFHGRADGRLSVLTRAAIMAFEQDHGLALTADASETVLSSILLGAVPAAGGAQRTVGPQAKQLIQLVQGLLIKAGYDDLQRTGRLDAPTRQAIRAFEARRGVVAKGRISAKLVAMLRHAVRPS